MNKAIEVALFLHFLAVAVWIGGMVFAHFCLRPAIADLSPQLRLPLWESVFGRFFNWVAASVLVSLWCYLSITAHDGLGLRLDPALSWIRGNSGVEKR